MNSFPKNKGITVITAFLFAKKSKKIERNFLNITKPVMFDRYSIAILGKGGEKSDSVRAQTSNFRIAL